MLYALFLVREHRCAGHKAMLAVSLHVLTFKCFINLLHLNFCLKVRTHGYWFLRRVSRTQQQQQDQQPASQVSTANSNAAPAAFSASAVGVVHTGSALSSSYVVTGKLQQQQQQQQPHTQQSVENEQDFVTRTDDVLDIAALITALRSGGKRERDADSDSSGCCSSSGGSTSGSSSRCAKRRNVYDAVDYKPAVASCHSNCSSGRSNGNSSTVAPPKMHYEQSLPVRGYFVQY
jgi:hypothetical protein